MKLKLKTTEPTRGASFDVRLAVGGPSITTRSRFMKAADVFRTGIERTNYGKKSAGGDLSKTAGDTKSQKPIRPRGNR
jgi:hypothetical protein